MRKLLFAILMMMLTQVPAGASSLFDDEDANNSVDTAGVQIPREVDSTGYTATFNLGTGDVDFVGLGPLVEGDLITAITVPLEDGEDGPFYSPDTIMGVFDAEGDILSFNDDGGDDGLGSVIRFRVESDGAHFIGIEGFGEEDFTGSHDEEGDYVLAISVTPAILSDHSPNMPPDCSAAIADPTKLRSRNGRSASGAQSIQSMLQSIWPIHYKMTDVSVDGVTDPEGDPVTLTITSIFQDEPVQNSGRRNACGDGAGVGTATASVRAKSLSNGDGRVYSIGFDASDGNDGECSGTVTVCVPDHQGRNATCVDQGPQFDSTDCDL